MAINFPNSPVSGQTYAYNSITWSWNGTAWEKITISGGSGTTGSTGATGATGPQGNTGATGPVGDYVLSFNGLTGAVTGVTTSTANLFTALNTFNVGISASGATFGNGPVTIAGYTAWHAGNDGATSALDAGLLYGVQGNIYASSLSTGLLYGGLLNINAGNTATFDISAGAGYIVTTGATFTAEPNPVITKVTWTAKTGVTLAGISAQDTTWVYIDSTGAVKQQAAFFTDDQVQSTIAVGALVHPSRSYISLAKTIPNVSYATDKQYEQFIRSFGPLKVSGHTIQANGANMRLNRTSGTAFILGRNYPNDPNNPSVVSDIAKTDAEIWRYYRGVTAGTFVTVTGITTGIDPTKYDNGTGTLASVSPSTPFTIQRVFFFPGTPNVLGVYYGTHEYASLAEAANNIHLEDFTEITNTSTNAVLAAFIIVKYNTTNLTTAIAADDARIIQGGQFRTTSSGGGSVATNLDSLTDVIITSVQDDDLLIYDTDTSQWLNTPLQHIGVSRFNGSTGAISGVNSVNGLTGALSLLASTGISIAAGGKGITFTNTGVQSFNGSTGAITGVATFNGSTGAVTGVTAVNAGTGISISGTTNPTITNTGVQSFNGSTGAITGVNSANGLTGTLTFFGGTGISVQAGGKGITLINTGVSSVNGLTGAVTLTSVSTGTVNNFTAQQNFTAGLSASSMNIVNGATFGYDVIITNNATLKSSYVNVLSVLPYAGSNTSGTLYINALDDGTGGANTITIIGDSVGDGNTTYLEVNDSTNNITLSANTIAVPSSLILGSGSVSITSISTALGTTAANQTISTTPVVSAGSPANRTVEYTIQASTGAAFESLKITAIHDGTNTYNTQYALIRSGGSLGTYTTTLTGTSNKSMLLRVTPTTVNTTYTVLTTVIPA